MAYRTLVRPQLEYGFEIWSLHTQTLVDEIEGVQRAAQWTKADFYRISSVTDMLHPRNYAG